MRIPDTGGIKRKILQADLTFFTAMLVTAVMPVYVKFLPPLMILWGLAWLWENDFRIGKSMFKENKAAILFFLFTGLYLWQISGLIFAHSLDSGIERILKRLSFLLFPLVLFHPGERVKNNIKLLIRIFASFTFLYTVFCFGRAFYNSLYFAGGALLFNPHPAEYEWENRFFGTYFSNPLHPSYMAFYVILSILISLEAFFEKDISYIRRSFWLLSGLALLGGLYFLSSRAGFLAAVVIFPAYFVLKLKGNASGWLVLSALVAALLIFIKIAATNEKIKSSLSEISKGDVLETIEKDTRNSIWQSALGVIKQNPLVGVGTGDASEELKMKFIIKGYNEGYYEDLNAHNQYLEIMLENGLIGLLIFLCIPVYMLFMAVKEKNVILGLFVVAMLIFFFFESILNRIAGVTFFPLFSFLLLHLKGTFVRPLGGQG